jgi:hypothetical protein
LVFFSAASSLLFGYIVAHMTSVISATNAHMFQRQTKLHELQAFFEAHQVPAPVKKKLYKFYRDRFNHNTELNDYIFRELPHDICADLDEYRHQTINLVCPVFSVTSIATGFVSTDQIDIRSSRYLYKDFHHMRWWRVLNMPSLPQAEKRFFCARLLPMRKLAKETLFCQGEEDESIYVIMDGQVKLSMTVERVSLKAHEAASLIHESQEVSNCPLPGPFYLTKSCLFVCLFGSVRFGSVWFGGVALFAGHGSTSAKS